jgi:hypothetical protein
MFSGLPLIADIDGFSYVRTKQQNVNALHERDKVKRCKGRPSPRASGGAPKVFETPQDKATLFKTVVSKLGDQVRPFIAQADEGRAL